MPKIPQEDDWITGAYAWVGIESGKIYVGGAYKSLVRRETIHRHLLNKGTHWNKHLQAAWNKYGEESFEFMVLERCPPDRVQEIEQKWIDAFGATDPRTGYNQCPTARSSLGFKHTPEFKAKMAEIGRTRVIGPERRAKISRSNRGKKHSEETLAKMREMRNTDEYHQKMSAIKKGQMADPMLRAKIGSATQAAMADPELRARLSRLAKARETKKRSKL